MRPIIYQLFVRHFSNAETGGVVNGSLAQNSCGTFAGINDAALAALAGMGYTHIWLTGVLRHATQTAHVGAAASPACIVKGVAGSPYAVSDYYSLDPDLASSPSAAMAEFEALLQRIRAWGMCPMMDFIPNHVSRDYYSPYAEAQGLSLGQHDDKNAFFAPQNAFYYLEDRQHHAPLRLPEGLFEPECEYGRVTGNNAATWQPSAYDWYETVKLNYGVDYRGGAAAAEHLPSMLSSAEQVPQTWRAMDDILAFWQGKGVGGFRCDMAHMVPMAFWRWLCARCRVRDSYTLLIAEAYNDHMKLSHGDVQVALLAVGFDAVYHAPSYEYLRKVYEAGYWMIDFDACNRSKQPLYQGGVRYLENHDEPRLCSPLYWGGHGECVSEALMLAQYASSAGPVLVYNGQEFGERAEGPAGYGGDAGRTSIFDYTCLPRLQQWSQAGLYNEDALSAAQCAHLQWMRRLFCLLQDPAFTVGDFYGLNWGNTGTLGFGRAAGEELSGRYTYAYLRHDAKTKSTLLAVCNLRPEGGGDSLTVSVPLDAQLWCGRGKGVHVFTDMLGSGEVWEISAEVLVEKGLVLPIPAGRAMLLRWVAKV